MIRYQCNTCDATFVRKSHLYAIEKPKCEFCAKEFVNNFVLKDHISKTHKEQKNESYVLPIFQVNFHYQIT